VRKLVRIGVSGEPNSHNGDKVERHDLSERRKRYTGSFLFKRSTPTRMTKQGGQLRDDSKGRQTFQTEKKTV